MLLYGHLGSWPSSFVRHRVYFCCGFVLRASFFSSHPARLSHPLAVVLLRRAEPVGRAAVGHAAADSRNSSRACRAIARPGRCPMLAGDGGRRRAVRGGVRRGQHCGGAQQRGGGDLLLQCVLQHHPDARWKTHFLHFLTKSQSKSHTFTKIV